MATLTACTVFVISIFVAAHATLIEPTLTIVPEFVLPPAYPAEGFTRAVRGFLLPDQFIPSDHVGAATGMAYTPVNATHGVLCTVYTVNKRWVISSAQCFSQASRQTTRVYVPSRTTNTYVVIGMNRIAVHKSVNLAMGRLRKWNNNVPDSRPKVHGSLSMAIRPDQTRVTLGFELDAEGKLFCTQYKQESLRGFCAVDGQQYLCMKSSEGAIDLGESGNQIVYNGAPMFGMQKIWNQRIAIIGMYTGASSSDVGDSDRLHYYVPIARYRFDLDEARFGNYTKWNLV